MTLLVSPVTENPLTVILPRIFCGTLRNARSRLVRFGLYIPVAELVNVKMPCLPDGTQSLLSR